MTIKAYLWLKFVLCLAQHLIVVLCDNAGQRTPRIAIVGSGMAGASTAWRLSQDTLLEVEITVFEADDRIGGRLEETTVRGPFEPGVTEKLVELGGTMGIEANRFVSPLKCNCWTSGCFVMLFWFLRRISVSSLHDSSQSKPVTANK
jgi:hypothetical protein